ncbi:Zn-ribbon domain-containing OB-fold protein [Ottowia thiooxydans]|uniref:Zn-ribbon domain-containing OB-fold protein n=1 Tax=Ottowia thiooxydans TaxID=219182 RepID=UPI00048CACCB|nr:OB-fold domain-containing protein [Ottowia thiooxydans]
MLDQITGAEKYYFSALGEGRFLIQSCEDCDKHVFYPRQLCPHCHSLNLSWIEPAGGATVYSTSVVRRKGEDGGDYNVAIVELDEGVRMMTCVEDISPTDVHIGMRVRATVSKGEQGNRVVFRTEERDQ